MTNLTTQLRTLSYLLKIATQDPLDIPWNEKQLLHLRDLKYKPLALYDIHPLEFLKLTTIETTFQKYLSPPTKNADFFKTPIVQQDLVIPPFLAFNCNDVIVNSEGRVRASAIYAQGGTKFRILLATEKCFLEKTFGWKFKICIPSDLYGQYNSYKHKIDKDKIKYINFR